MKLRWFKNEKGSTSLTIVLGIALSVVLLASSVQWYWTNSSSSDIQTVADISALSAADVTAKSVMLIQALDALLLSANLFGLVLHAVTIVAGLLTVLSAPVGGAGAAAFFERSVQFNKNYSENRRRFAKEAHSFASKVSDATPYLAMAQAYQVANENSHHLEGFNGTGYMAIALPFPAKGEVHLTGFPESEDQLLEEVSAASEDNRESAHKVKRLEDEVEAAIDECFRLDIYLPAGTARPFWNPLSAIDDFARGWSELMNKSAPAQVGLVPVTDSGGNRETLQERYRQDHKDIAQSLESEVKSTLDTARNSEGADVQDLTVSTLLNSVKQERIYLVVHEQGERKAYHQQSNCFGLSNAGEIRNHTLSYVVGDTDHPPCLLCSPTHWQALEAWEQHMTKYVSAWNREAAALRRWYAAEQELREEQDIIQERTESALKRLLEEAQSYLLGGRLTYTPAGARGYLCIVMSTQERGLPAFALPALTDSGDVVLGRQVAMAGARMMPSEAETTIPDLLSESHYLAERGAEGGFAELMRNLVTEDGPLTSSGVPSGALSEVSSSGGGGGIAGFLLRIWGSCLSLYTKGSNNLKEFVSGLPFGLDTVMSKSLDSFFETAQISAPDLRRPVPVLVNTSEVGDSSAGGFEGRIVTSIGSAKDGLEKSGGASIVGLRENLAGMINELDADVGKRIEEMMKIQVLGVSIPLPFSETVKGMASRVFVLIRSKEEEFFAALGA
ncbi:MAG: hypothetical protein FWE48_00415 [Coriobacteriia bacterium]|nr:hypothetical protein [Coriobacteriia bacterium]